VALRAAKVKALAIQMQVIECRDVFTGAYHARHSCIGFGRHIVLRAGCGQ
jgi:hypothetical protein